MDAGSPTNERQSLQAENRHLKEMVAALRAEMERMRIGEQERVQQALAASREEIDQLKKMIVALRDELERRRIDGDEQCRAVEQAARNEARQLHEMIAALREKLEAYGRR